ncbi:O-antigen ligase [Cellvibrio sp. PSBB006]|uniref:O-antigen ligase family protein n=1 Tax=Cellvibrio sp. PSBB006 TaxID=1987723 RepID=UPI000B3B4FDD|nr:O-antigen ligase family protein [Cellvibrio sp. PSBB006]ARU28265.1 hypothetical protein CBR65_12970 [Cellvibrio sp. PSBB006]
MKPHKVDDFFAFRIGALWQHFKTEHFSFWMICSYLFFEFVRPQAIFPIIDFLPWAQLLLILSLIGAILDPTVKWTSSPVNKWLIFFLIAIIASIYTAFDPAFSKRFFMDFFGWFVIYFLIINIINTKERFYIFLLVLLFAAAKIAIGTSKTWALRGFTFTGWGLMGPRGYFQNSGELAILMLVLFPLSFFLYTALKDRIKKWERFFLIICWVCPILTILGASSRGAQLALAIQLAFIFRKNLFKPKQLIGILVLCFGLFFLLPEEQKNRFSSAGNDKTSQQRLLYWENGWEMMKEHPFLGVGYFNFIPYYEIHYPQDMLYPRAELPHNIFIQVGTDTGFIGLFFFIMIIGNCFFTVRKIIRAKHLEKTWPSIAAGLGYGVLGFVLAGQFVTVTYYPFLWISLAFIVSLHRVLDDGNNPLNQGPR